jgi:tetratricopeptide (TPR) repeat protein
MAPEQLAMVADAGAPAPGDWRPCDVFAFGVMLTELLTGRHPFGAGGVPAEAGQTEAAARLLAAQKAGAAALPAHVPPAVRAALSRCLELDPVQRPTAAELAKLFGPTRPPPRTRRRLLLALAALSTALALASLIPGRGAPAPQPKDEARAAPAEPPPPTDAFARGVACFHRKEYVQGWHEFQRAGEEKKDGRAHACAAYCFALLKDHRAAIPEWDKAIRLNYRDPAVYANRAFSYLQRGQHERAKADCDEALRLDPDLRAARLTRAVYHLRQHARGEGLAPEAVADIEKVLTGEPNTAEVWMTAAQIFAGASADRRDLLERAADAVRRAILAGKEPRLISRNPLLVKALGGRPSFQAALRTAPGVPQAAPDPQMVNVIP